MRPAAGAPVRVYIRTGVIQKPVLRIRKYAMLRYTTLWRIFYAKLRKNQEKLYKKWSFYFERQYLSYLLADFPEIFRSYSWKPKDWISYIKKAITKKNSGCLATDQPWIFYPL